MERLCIGSPADERGDRVQSVEEEVRLNLESQGVELSASELGLESCFAQFPAPVSVRRRETVAGRHEQYIDQKV